MSARGLALVGLCGAAVLAGSTASAGPAATPVQRACGDKAITILFWPKGHNVIRSLGFPASPRPHLELYRYAGAQTYRSTNAIGFVEAGGPAKLSPRCKSQPATSKLSSAFSKTSTGKVIATCSFPAGMRIQTQKVGTVWEVRMFDPPTKVVLRARIAPTKSTLYTTQQCAIGAAPS